jgi:hypothetical protein
LEQLVTTLPLIEQGTSPDFSIAFGGRVRMSDVAWTFETSAQDLDGFKRLLSCFFIAAMPSDGVDEALSSLRDVYDFYRPLEVGHASALAVVAGSAVVGEQHDRAHLILQD